MTQVNTDHVALRDADTVKSQPREDKRASFQSHVRQEKNKGDVAGLATTAHEPPDGTLNGSLVDLTLPSVVRALPDDIVALPLASTDAVFGAGATIYPQGLAVVGYLSMLPAGDDTAELPGSVPAVAQATVAGSPTVTLAAWSTPSAASDAANRMSPDGLSAVAVDTTMSAEGGAASTDPALSTMDGAELTPWLLRRMSFSGKGADATLRLRDYRLPAGHEGELAEGLLAIARAQGWPAARVVVNGREIWRQSGVSPSPDTQRTQDHVG